MPSADDHQAGFGPVLRSARRNAHLTQEELAEASGVAARTISDIERGKVRTTHRDTARRLADALRLAPDERTRFEEAARGRPTAAAPHPVPEITFRQLHPPPTPLIGRDDVVRAVADTLARPDVRIVTITGTGGVGKTRVALAAARLAAPDFTDGMSDVDLTLVADPTQAVSHLVRAVGGEIRTGDAAELAEVLGARQVLLVLDNFEHVLAAAPAIATVVARCPNLKVLVTSRVALRIRGEHEYEVQPLPVPGSDGADGTAIGESPSVELFAWHARARQADWELTGSNAAAVAGVCRFLDGVPLAIELAAARIGLFPVEVIADRLAHRLGRIRLLTTGPRDAPDRQRTLPAAIGWSVDLLPEGVQRLLGRLSVFPAGYSVEIAETVCGGAGLDLDVLDGLTLLGDHHLHRSLDRGRFAMYEAVREFAAVLHRSQGEEGAVADRHTGYVLTIAERAAPELAGAEQVRWLDRLEELRYDIAAVLARTLPDGDPATAVRLAGAVWRFWYSRGAIADGRRWLEEALGAADPDPVDPDQAGFRARALNGAAALGHYLGADTALVGARYRAAGELWRRVGDDVGLAGTLSNLAMLYQYSNQTAEARRTYDEALVAARRIGDLRVTGTALLNLGILLVQEGELDRAGPALHEALRLFQRAGNTRAIADVHTAQALLATAARDYAAAERLAERSRVMFRELQDELGDTEALLVVAQAVELSGADDDRARRMYESGLVTCRRLADAWGPGLALIGLGRLALRRGDHRAAADLADEALAQYSTLDFDIGVRIAQALRRTVESCRLDAAHVPDAEIYALLPP